SPRARPPDPSSIPDPISAATTASTRTIRRSYTARVAPPCRGSRHAPRAARGRPPRAPSAHVRQHDRAVGPAHHVVLDPDAELAGEIDARLHREHEAGLETLLVAADQIGGFVTVHAQAVADAVGELRTEAGPLDHLARCAVDVLRRDAGPDAVDRRALGVEHD